MQKYRSGKQKSTMKHDFAKVPEAKIQRSNFRRNHGLKTMFNAGFLIPIYVDEALPGDTINLKMSTVARIQAVLFPYMDNLWLDFFFFAVPNRLIWTNWQAFMGEHDEAGIQDTDYLVPKQTTPSLGYLEESLADYMGIPIHVDNLDVDALHFRAYNLIYNEWFRDQNLQDSIVVDKGDGPDLDTDYVLKKRGKRHDYFTSCLPWPQKGTEIELPLGVTAPVITGDDRIFGTAEANMRMWDPQNGTYVAADASLFIEGVTGDVTGSVEDKTGDEHAVPSNLYADLETATASTINSLREAFQLQKLLERDARGGTRYTEIIKSHFLVDSPDARLQRPEYLGGGTSPLNVIPVPSTTEALTRLGQMGGNAYHSQSGIGFTKSFVEHSVIIGMVCARADLTYQQGLRKMWSRQTKYDFFWPALANLGEQEVLNKEIFAQGIPADELVFGYQERWSEYRMQNSLITGKLRSDSAAGLDAWHLSIDFATLPVLNSDFIEENPPLTRIKAIVDEPDIVFDSYFDIVSTRPMPSYSVPGLIDHF